MTKYNFWKRAYLPYDSMRGSLMMGGTAAGRHDGRKLWHHSFTYPQEAGRVWTWHRFINSQSPEFLYTLQAGWTLRKGPAAELNWAVFALELLWVAWQGPGNWWAQAEGEGSILPAPPDCSEDLHTTHRMPIAGPMVAAGPLLSWRWGS